MPLVPAIEAMMLTIYVRAPQTCDPVVTNQVSLGVSA
jgi:hypothetical protein